jgi:hydrogenase maturation protease
LICCLGNPIVKNDCIGVWIGRRLAGDLPAGATLAVREFTGAPLDLLTEIAGWDRAILIDAVVTGTAAPGTVMVFAEQDLAHSRVGVYPHGFNLPQALALGRGMNIALPARLILIGIEVEFPDRFGETVSEALQRNMDRICAEVRQIIADECRRL